MRVLVVAAGALLLAPVQDQFVQEKYPSGRVKEEYRVDRSGARHGAYTAYHENGKKRQTGSYDRGARDGTWDDFAETGRHVFRRRYAKGTLTEVIGLDEKGAPFAHLAIAGGMATLRAPGSKAGEPAHPRTREEIRERLGELRPAPFAGDTPYEQRPSAAVPFAAGKLKAAYLADALGHLNQYRWLCGVPADVALDPDNLDLAQHGAVIQEALKQRTHNPSKPEGMDDAFFQKAFLAVNKGNVASGPNLRGAIDYYLYDSDGGIRTVGHRLYLLNPAMRKIAFGQSGEYVCYWPTSEGEGRRPDLLRYPAAGWFPTEYLWPQAAWSVTVHPGRYKIGDRKDVRVRVWSLARDFDLERELPVDSVNVSGGTVIFRPRLETPKGARVLVSIAGVKDAKGAEGPLQYVVELYPLSE